MNDWTNERRNYENFDEQSNKRPNDTYTRVVLVWEWEWVAMKWLRMPWEKLFPSIYRQGGGLGGEAGISGRRQRLMEDKHVLVMYKVKIVCRPQCVIRISMRCKKGWRCPRRRRSRRRCAGAAWTRRVMLRSTLLELIIVVRAVIPLRACSVIFNPYGLEGIDTDWRGFWLISDWNPLNPPQFIWIGVEPNKPWMDWTCTTLSASPSQSLCSFLVGQAEVQEGTKVPTCNWLRWSCCQRPPRS
jgi:hypothetical protein